MAPCDGGGRGDHADADRGRPARGPGAGRQRHGFAVQHTAIRYARMAGTGAQGHASRRRRQPVLRQPWPVAGAPRQCRRARACGAVRRRAGRLRGGAQRHAPRHRLRRHRGGGAVARPLGPWRRPAEGVRADPRRRRRERKRAGLSASGHVRRARPAPAGWRRAADSALLPTPDELAARGCRTAW